MYRTAYFHNDVYIPLNVPRTNSMRTDNTDPRYSHAIAGHARNNCALLGPSTEDLSEVGEACVIRQLWRPWEEPSNPGLSLPTINSRLDVTSIVFEVRILIYRFNLPSFILSNITRLEDYTYPYACILQVCFTRLLLYCFVRTLWHRYRSALRFELLGGQIGRPRSLKSGEKQRYHKYYFSKLIIKFTILRAFIFLIKKSTAIYFLFFFLNSRPQMNAQEKQR